MKVKDQQILNKIGALVLRIRSEKNLSQDDVASRCDVDRGKISKIETGSANFYITTLIELAKGLGVDPKDLMKF
jgi:transcriptional regulator with XRE-family HTH domain